MQLYIRLLYFELCICTSLMAMLIFRDFLMSSFVTYQSFSDYYQDFCMLYFSFNALDQSSVPYLHSGLINNMYLPFQVNFQFRTSPGQIVEDLGYLFHFFWFLLHYQINFLFNTNPRYFTLSFYRIATLLILISGLFFLFNVKHILLSCLVLILMNHLSIQSLSLMKFSSSLLCIFSSFNYNYIIV